MEKKKMAIRIYDNFLVMPFASDFVEQNFVFNKNDKGYTNELVLLTPKFKDKDSLKLFLDNHFKVYFNGDYDITYGDSEYIYSNSYIKEIRIITNKNEYWARVCLVYEFLAN